MEIRMIKDSKGYHHAEIVTYERDGSLERVKELPRSKNSGRAIKSAVEEAGKHVGALLSYGKNVAISIPDAAVTETDES